MNRYTSVFANGLFKMAVELGIYAIQAVMFAAALLFMVAVVSAVFWIGVKAGYLPSPGDDFFFMVLGPWGVGAMVLGLIVYIYRIGKEG